MFRKIGHRMVAMAPETGSDGAAAPGGDATPTDDAAAIAAAAAAEEEKKDPNHFELTPSFWETQVEKTDNNNGNQGGNQQQQQTQQTETTDVFADHVAKLDFGQFEMSPEDISGFIATGDVAGLGKAVTAHSRGVYSQVMKDTATLMKQSRETIMNDVRAEIASTSGAANDLSALHKAVGITQNPALQPVAVAIMKQAMSKPGVTQAQGVQAVKEFFKVMREEDTGDGNNFSHSSPNNSGGSYRGNQSEEVDWAKELAG